MYSRREFLFEDEAYATSLSSIVDRDDLMVTALLKICDGDSNSVTIGGSFNDHVTAVPLLETLGRIRDHIDRFEQAIQEEL